jgi:hypothetical protein
MFFSHQMAPDSDTIDLSDDSVTPEAEVQLLEQFPVVDTEISYQEFFSEYISKNVPCLIRVGSMMDHWPSLTDWCDTDGCRIDFFSQILPSDLVTVLKKKLFLFRNIIFIY